MGSAASAQMENGDVTMAGPSLADQPVDVENNFFENVKGQKYRCCLENGNTYRRTPRHQDINTDVEPVKYGDVLAPKLKYGQWIQIDDEKWLPLEMYWIPVCNGNHIQLMARCDGVGTAVAILPSDTSDVRSTESKGDDDEDNTTPSRPYSRSWDIVDKTVQAVAVNDVLDVVLDRFDEIKAKAIVKIQAAVRGRQMRAEKKKKKKERLAAKLAKKDAEIERLRKELERRAIKEKAQKKGRAARKKAANAAKKAKEMEKEEQMRMSLAQRELSPRKPLDELPP